MHQEYARDAAEVRPLSVLFCGLGGRGQARPLGWWGPLAHGDGLSQSQIKAGPSPLLPMLVAGCCFRPSRSSIRGMARRPQVAAGYGVDLSKGLSDTDVFKARSRYGRNELAPEEGAVGPTHVLRAEARPPHRRYGGACLDQLSTATHVAAPGIKPPSAVTAGRQ